MKVITAQTDAEIQRCWPVMAELRPHVTEAEFLNRVRRQMTGGYLLAYVEAGDEITAVAGYRFLTNLAWGNFLYVDDLVTAEKHRSTGNGAYLLQWLCQQARKAGCERLELDSGVQRFQAHRFYLREGMIISSHHFSKQLDGQKLVQ